jgi:hypothetical protein
MLQSDFYKTLLPIEQVYWHKLAELFQRVNPQKPEKGIQALILRARNAATENAGLLEEELERTFQAAKERTERRIQLLSQCHLPTQ